MAVDIQRGGPGATQLGGRPPVTATGHKRRLRRWSAVSALAVLVGAAVLVHQLAQPELLLEEDFEGPDGVFVTASTLWNPEPVLQPNPRWVSESGELLRVDSTGRTESPFFRMWSRNDDLSFSALAADVTLDGWVGGDEPWHGLTLWLNAGLCVPVPSCAEIDDNEGVGESGYALDFANRDGSLTILKKVAGDTRDRWPGASAFSQGGTYYVLAEGELRPEAGRTYRVEGSATREDDGAAVLRVVVDGEPVIQALDDGRRGGPVLTGPRVGLRSDQARLMVDSLTVSR